MIIRTSSRTESFISQHSTPEKLIPISAGDLRSAYISLDPSRIIILGEMVLLLPLRLLISIRWCLRCKVFFFFFSCLFSQLIRETKRINNLFKVQRHMPNPRLLIYSIKRFFCVDGFPYLGKYLISLSSVLTFFLAHSTLSLISWP